MILLGGLAPGTFLRRYWQKRPLLVRRALPRFAGLEDEARDGRTLFELASRDDVESRIVVRRGRRWETEHGPFDDAKIPRRRSTLLVSGVNLHVAAADALLRRFAFVPQARIDDVMVSYATPGGGVGPHVDSYDVFLLQGPGRRRWSYWLGNRKKTVVMSAGDLLYLPPGVRHDGVALDRCFTYSIGFRAPGGAELAAAFLDWLHSRGLPDARYRDPGLAPARHAGAIPPAMTAFCARTLRRIRWSAADVAAFLGAYLTEPKAHVVFRQASARKLSNRTTVCLHPKSQLLYAGARFFINGEALPIEARKRPALRELADLRRIASSRIAAAGLGDLIYRWQKLGYVTLERT